MRGYILTWCGHDLSVRACACGRGVMIAKLVRYHVRVLRAILRAVLGIFVPRRSDVDVMCCCVGARARALMPKIQVGNLNIHRPHKTTK